MKLISPARAAFLAAIVSFVAAAIFLPARAQETYDVVIANGRVMDPESGLDAVRNVGILAGKIRAISTSPLAAKTTLDATGLVVAPGFIDLHEHGQTAEKYRYEAHDGVTTSLELERGTGDVDSWYAAREGKSLINFGVSVGHIPVRMQVMHDPGTFLPLGDAAHRAASSEELAAITQGIEAGLQRGALAVGMGIAYTPAASRGEILEVFRSAAKYHASVHVHIRYAGLQEPESALAALQEVIADAAVTGAPLHVVHVTSMGLKDTPQLLSMIEAARSRGLDVSTECYPYTASSTALESPIFDPGWQEKLGISYHDLEWSATGERLTPETFAQYRRQGGNVVVFDIPGSAARAAVANPIVMIASDGIWTTGPNIHPRGQGTFSRVLGYYVREQHALDLMTSLRKMTLMPAQRLENRAPAFRDKGRIQIGADADITVFNPATVLDRATYEHPLQYSQGIQFVLVNGTPVLKDGALLDGVFPGRPVRASITQQK